MKRVIQFVLLLGIFLAPLPLGAQTVLSVRAVEHPEYSRLVIPIPPGTRWALSNSGMEARVEFAELDSQLDVGPVFDRMPRTRILSVNISGKPPAQRLTLKLACSCEVSAKEFEDRYLYLDVRRAVFSAGTGQPRFLVPGTRAPAVGATPHLSERLPKISTTAGDSWTAQGEGSAISPDQGRGAVERAQTALFRQLSKAAEEGLLNLAPDVGREIPDPGPIPRMEPDAPPDPLVHQDAAPYRLTPQVLEADSFPSRLDHFLSPHLRLRDGLGKKTRNEAMIVAQEQATCPGDEALDVRSWAISDQGFSEALGRQRAELVDLTGAVNARAVAALAQLYIGAGFGREADALLTAHGQAVRESAVLIDIARLVEGRATDASGPVGTAIECLGRINLWRVAAGFDPLVLDGPIGETVVETLMELPPRLRRLVGQNVAQRAVKAGALEEARGIIDLLDRTPGVLPDLERHARASLSLAEGEPAKVREVLGQDAESAATPDPRAILIRANAILDAKKLPPDGFLDTLVAAMAPQRYHPVMGPELYIAHARLMAAEGRALGGLARLRELRQIQPEQAVEIDRAARSILSRLPDDIISGVSGAQAVLENVEFLSDDGVSRSLRLRYGTALIEAGLPNAALILLSETGTLPNAEIRLAKARAHLALSQFPDALAAMDGLDGPEAARLLAAVYLRDGSPNLALAALSPFGSKDPERNHMAILSGDWATLDAVAENGRFGAIAGYALRNGQMPAVRAASPGTGTIAVARDALEGARAFRAALSVDLDD